MTTVMAEREAASCLHSRNHVAMATLAQIRRAHPDHTYIMGEGDWAVVWCRPTIELFSTQLEAGAASAGDCGFDCRGCEHHLMYHLDPEQVAVASNRQGGHSRSIRRWIDAE